MNQTLLIELLTEELPPKALAKLSAAFANGMFNALKARAFLEDNSLLTAYATPRRLALTISNVRPASPDKAIREKVLPVSVALDAQGNASAPLGKKLAALAGQAGVASIALAQLERAADGKAESFFFTYTAAGAQLVAGLQESLEEAVARLPIPRLMSYQRPDGSTVQFVRPVHRLTALHGAGVVPVAILGLAAGRTTLGHRFLSSGEIVIHDADTYALTLEKRGHVLAGLEERRERLVAGLTEAAGEDRILMPEALLDEVNALVEWPVVYACNFEAEFLAVPQECLVLTMQTNQKYFALTDEQGKLRSRFLIVSNIATDTPRHIIEGNERVVRPRLSDAKFFFEQDKKRTLADRLPGLENVVYHNKLGTQAERTQRVGKLAGAIAAMLGADVALAERAALLAKTDLLTDMVGEFPELQGVMGTYYARHDGENDEVATAISEHYQPRYAGDALPSTMTGTIVALADKLETLTGIWGIGLQPTGDKDPFALRRHALGILRMLVEKRLPLDIGRLLETAMTLFAGKPDFTFVPADAAAFLYDRLRGLLRERGFSPNEIEAVVAQQPQRLDNISERLEAVQAFALLPQAQSLAAANKRITNILRKTAGEVAVGAVDPALLQEDAERALYAALGGIEGQVKTAFAAGDFTGTLKALASLRDPVDAFFNGVMVMADEPALRANRINLLSQLHGMMNQVADISKLAA